MQKTIRKIMQKTLFLSAFLIISFIITNNQARSAEPFRFEEQDAKQLTLFEGETPVLTYRYDMVEHENVPEDNPKAAPRRRAGCYVHPLYGLNGEILTANAPKDHYHHHGVFWTWPHVGVHLPNGSIKHYDLWESNTALKQHFVRWIDRKTTSFAATCCMENGWFVGDPAQSEKIMSEQVRIIVHRPEIQTDGLKTRAIDFEFVWKPVGNPISLRGREEKSYGGFTVRFNPFIPDDDVEGKRRNNAKPSAINVITVPDGVAKRDLPETPLAWADYTSRFGNDETRSGAAIFVPETHPDFPPTWLTRYYGAMCVGWPGVHDRTFQSGEEIKLQYRVWIHDAPVTTEQIEKAYERYNNRENVRPDSRERQRSAMKRPFRAERNREKFFIKR